MALTIFALTGLDGCGKNTIADLLGEITAGAQQSQHAFAAPVRAELAQCYPLSIGADPSFLSDRAKKEEPCDELALIHAKNPAYVTRMLELARRHMGEDIDEAAYLRAPRSPRWALRHYATEYRRQVDGDDYWIRQVESELQAHRLHAKQGRPHVACITDFRHQAESRFLDDYAGANREDVSVASFRLLSSRLAQPRRPEELHTSEAESLTLAVAATLDNDGDVSWTIWQLANEILNVHASQKAFPAGLVDQIVDAAMRELGRSEILTPLSPAASEGRILEAASALASASQLLESLTHLCDEPSITPLMLALQASLVGARYMDPAHRRLPLSPAMCMAMYERQTALFERSLAEIARLQALAQSRQLLLESETLHRIGECQATLRTLFQTREREKATMKSSPVLAKREPTSLFALTASQQAALATMLETRVDLPADLVAELRAALATPIEPTVMVGIEGDWAQGATANLPVNVILIDHDMKDDNPDKVRELNVYVDQTEFEEMYQEFIADRDELSEEEVVSASERP